MKHSASLLYSFILLIADFAALVGAFALAFIVRVKLDDRPLLEPITALEYIGVIATLLVFWLATFGLLGLYRSQVYENRFKEFALLLVGSFIGIQFLITSEYVLNRSVFPARLVTVYGFIFALLLTLLLRTIARGVRRILFKFGVGINRVLLIGSNEITTEFAHLLGREGHGYAISGVVGDKRVSYPHVRSDQKFKNFSSAIEELNSSQIQSIVQTELFADDYKNDEILAYAQKNHIAYRFIPGNSRMYVGSIDVDLFENIPTISVHQSALNGWGRVAKRLFDILGGTIFLILSMPVMLGVYLLLEIFGGGAAVYTQTRMSRFDSKIKLLKFRTHKREYSGGLTPEQVFEKMGRPELSKKYRANGDYLENDPRISQMGKFLRKTSLDELPQILNVIRGDLSLVGPRPLIPEELQQYHSKSVILSVKPGLTGLAVVSGRRNIDYKQRRKLDTYYAQNWSFLMDIVIILKTIVHVIGRVGAK